MRLGVALGGCGAQGRRKVDSRTLRPAPPGNEKSTFWQKKPPKGRILEPTAIQKGSKIMILSIDRHFGVKSGLQEAFRKKHEKWKENGSTNERFWDAEKLSRIALCV